MTLSPRLRTLALCVHLTISGCWLGSVVAFAALAISGLAGTNALLVRAAYVDMGLIVSAVIAPLAIAALATGIVSAVGTRWGLLRHYWVVVKLVLTLFAVVILLAQLAPICHLAHLATDPNQSIAVLQATPRPLIHAVGGLIVLLIIQILGVYKPAGMTRYGWRKQHEEAAQRAA